MKRLTDDVNRWHLYLYRKSVGLPLVDDCDTRERRLGDEIFGRLYAGEPVTILKPDPQDAAWAKAAHAEAEKAVSGLAPLCRGDVCKAAQATKEVLASLEKPSSAPPTAAQQQQAAGLSGVQFGSAPWSGKWEGQQAEDGRAKTLAEKLAQDERLKKIAMLAGKFKRIAVTKQKVRVHRGADEVSDVVQGDDIARLLPSELARMASPGLRRLAALRDYSERRLLQYRMTSLEDLGRGPLILCLDKSGSMVGEKDVWSSAVALAMCETIHKQHRPFIILGFNHEVFYRAVVKVGRPMPEASLFVPCGGGTDVSKVLDLALHAVESRNVMRRADVVIVTDGESSTEKAAWLRGRAKAHNVRIFGVGIGVPAQALTSWCDEAVATTKLDGIDDETAEVLFGR